MRKLAVVLVLGACSSAPPAAEPAPSNPALTSEASSTTSVADITPSDTATSPETTAAELDEAACPDPANPPASSGTDEARATAAAEVFDHRPFAEVDVSISVWRGDVEVFAVNGDTELFPASNQKLFTAIGTLLFLDSSDRFSTTIERAGEDLVLRAGGDPTLTGNSLVDLALQVRAAGIAEVDSLVVDAGHFEAATTTAGRLEWQMPTYTGPLSAFTVDDNQWRTDQSFLDDPALGNSERLADELRRAGVAVRTVARRDGAADLDRETEIVAELVSPPVAELMSSMLMGSDNEIAEALLREIGSGETASGINRIDRALADRCIELSGRSGDGSGLSRDNMRSAREWARLLRFADTQPWGTDLFDALPVAGRSGTLAGRLGGPATNGTVRAKTGSIIGGRALSGVIETQDGPLYSSIITNGEPNAAAATVDVIDRLVSVLAAA